VVEQGALSSTGVVTIRTSPIAERETLMPLTPIDIQQKTFGPELRGYNMDEVDDFLDEVVVALKDYDQRLRDAEDRIRALEAELSTRGEDESAISRALVAAQKQADNVIIDAKADAEKIRRDAQGEADQLRADRDAERMSLTQDIARMRATVADLKRRVVDLARSAEADLDAIDESASSASTALGSGILDQPVEADHDQIDQEEVSEEASEDADALEAATDHGLESMAVGAGMHPFDGEGGGEDDGEELTGTQAAGQHLSASEPVPADESDVWSEGDTEESEVVAEGEVEEDAEEASAAEEESDQPGGEDERPPFRERRPWERGSV
jgi:cell division initiation protein